eukprot:1837017-Pleurochrysis_carterae.AAC.9
MAVDGWELMTHLGSEGGGQRRDGPAAAGKSGRAMVGGRGVKAVSSACLCSHSCACDALCAALGVKVCERE